MDDVDPESGTSRSRTTTTNPPNVATTATRGSLQIQSPSNSKQGFGERLDTLRRRYLQISKRRLPCYRRSQDLKKSVKEVVESKGLQRTILLLVILDLVIVAVSVQFPAFGLLSFLNALADRVLLIIFMLEAVALAYVLSPREYIRKPWHVIDGIFIIVSTILEIHEITVHEDDLHPASPFVGLSIRVWRILRIVHAFTVAIELEYQEAQNSSQLEMRLRDMMQRVSNLESELYHEKHARAALERELARLNRIKRSYDAVGIRVPI